MPRDKALGLITELHERFGDAEQSPEQVRLLRDLEQHIHELDEAEKPRADFVEPLETILAEAEIKHPAIATLVRSLLDTLKNIGV